MIKRLFFYFSYQFKRALKIVKIPSITVQYPFVSKQIPLFSRQKLRLNVKDCTACMACEEGCPTKAIEITHRPLDLREEKPRSSKGYVFEKQITQMQIDYSKCTFCGYCVELCAPEALSYERALPSSEQEPNLLKKTLIRTGQIPSVLRG